MAIVEIDVVYYGSYGYYEVDRYAALLDGAQSPPPGTVYRARLPEGGLPIEEPPWLSPRFYGYVLAGDGVVQDYRGATFEGADDIYVDAQNSTFRFGDSPMALKLWLSVPGGNTYFMGEGDDTLAMGESSTVYGGGGNDRIMQAGYAEGGEGDDLFSRVTQAYGGDGDDRASSGTPTFYGGDGIDQIASGDRENLILGRIDSVEQLRTYVNITILMQYLPEGRLSIDDYFGGAEVMFAERTSTPEILFGDGPSDILGPATFDIAGYDKIRFRLGGGDDVYQAQTRAETDLTVYGGSGADTMLGAPGRDVFYGADDEDVLEGGGGSDLLWGQDGDDLSRGGGGGDRIFSGFGDDTAFGRHGDDILYGDDTYAPSVAGNDRLYGGRAADTLYGGEGDDLLKGGRGRDRLEGEGGHDNLRGGEGRDVMDGGAGDDDLRGNAGADTLFGGAGADELFGGKGGDTLDFNLDDQTAAGGRGADLFVVARGDGLDTVVDFEHGPDRVRIVSGATAFNELEITQRGDRTYVTYALNTDVLALVGVDADNLRAADFLFDA